MRILNSEVYLKSESTDTRLPNSSLINNLTSTDHEASADDTSRVVQIVYHVLQRYEKTVFKDFNMRSVRLDEELETRLEETARMTGKTVSEIVREAVKRHCDELAQPNLREKLGYAIGAVRSGGSDAKRNREEYVRHLTNRHSRRKPK